LKSPQILRSRASISLPVVKLLDQVDSSVATEAVRNVALIYLAMGLSRMPREHIAPLCHRVFAATEGKLVD
jgi:hypothetical protein